MKKATREKKKEIIRLTQVYTDPIFPVWNSTATEIEDPIEGKGWKIQMSTSYNIVWPAVKKPNHHRKVRKG